MRQIKAAHDRTGHRRLAVVLCWVIVASFSPFFWLSKVMETQPAAVSLSRPSAVVTLWSRPSMDVLKKRILFSVSSFVRFVSACSVVENSHERIAKNRAPTISSPKAMFLGVLLSSWIALQTFRGRHA